MLTWYLKLTILAASTYPVFDASSHREELGSILSSFADSVGFKGEIQYRPAETPYEEAMVTVTNMKPHKAMGLLGWTPKQIGFAQGMEIYAASYKAWKE
jgi:nucleoside-diphosphate-sugar epimerase